MIISFFEEFPTEKNLDKLRLVSWQTKLYVAAESLGQFETIKQRILARTRKGAVKNKKINIKEFVYWPILKKEEGYWISPFSKRKALKRIFSELHGKSIPVMLDLELPLSKNFLLLVLQFINFVRNKRLIGKFIRSHSKSYACEYYPEGRLKEKIFSLLGLHYPLRQGVSVIKMLYHSMHHFDRQFVADEMREGRLEFGNKFIAAYGTIARGINGNEPILSYKQLEQDLRTAKQFGLKEVIIYRLGGLNKRYAKLLERFAD